MIQDFEFLDIFTFLMLVEEHVVGCLVQVYSEKCLICMWMEMGRKVVKSLILVQRKLVSTQPLWYDGYIRRDIRRQ